MGDVIALRQRGGDGDAATLLVAGDGVHGHRLLHRRHIAQREGLVLVLLVLAGDLAQLPGGVAHGGRRAVRGDLHVQQLLFREDAALRRVHGQIHAVAVQRNVGDAGGALQRGSHLHIDLRHGHAVLRRRLPVNDHLQRRSGLVQPVVDLAHARHLLQPLGHVVAEYLQRNAAAGHIAHHLAHNAGGSDLTGQVGAQRLDLLPRHGAEGTLRHGDVAGDVVFPRLAARHIQSAHVAAAHHKARVLHVLHGHDALDDRVRQLHRLLAGGARRHGDRQGQVVHVHLRHERKAAAHRRPAAGHQQHKGQQQHARLVIQRKDDGLTIGGIEPIQQSRLLHLLPAQHTGRHSGHQRQCHQQARQQRIGDGQSEIGKQLARQPLHEHDGREHADGGQRGRRHRAQHLLCAGHRRLHHGGTLRPQPVDILDDHHRVIHQHTHRHRQTA